jgi:hypothetical protein
VVARLECLLEGAALAAQRLFVEDVQRRTELPREFDGVASAEREVATFSDTGRDGQDVREGDFGSADQEASLRADYTFAVT